MTGRNPALAARDLRMASLAKEGKTVNEIASIECVHQHVVRIWARIAKVKLARAPRVLAEKDSARTAKMISMHSQGVSLEKIGTQFGITRERVRQILDRQGISAKNGGASIGRAAKREYREMRREATYFVKYGLPYAVVKQLRKDRVTHAFSSQRKSADTRGIEWNLTFAQWFAIWQASGKLHLRGRGKGKYCMSRVCDSGGYALGNVHIQLSTENNAEAVLKWKGKIKENRGVFLIYPGREMAWLAKVGKKSLGFFKTEGEAAAARAAYFEANPEIRQAAFGRGYTPIRSQRKNGGPVRYQVVVKGKYLGTFPTTADAVAARNAFLSKELERLEV